MPKNTIRYRSFYFIEFFLREFILDMVSLIKVCLQVEGRLLSSMYAKARLECIHLILNAGNIYSYIYVFSDSVTVWEIGWKSDLILV